MADEGIILNLSVNQNTSNLVVHFLILFLYMLNITIKTTILRLCMIG